MGSRRTGSPTSWRSRSTSLRTRRSMSSPWVRPTSPGKSCLATPTFSFTTRPKRSKMSPRNAERIALVTGSNRGIGLEAARQLARRGFHAVIASRDEGKGRTAAEGIQAGGGKATFLPLDVSSSESIRTAVRRFGAIADRLDVLVNNAGVYPDGGVTVLTLSRDRLAQTLQTNTL